eukprot:jgi/Antlo1/522/1105
MSLDFKSIQPVPLSTHLIDIVLNDTQCRTPTVIHPQFPIRKIISFYMRKVKHTAAEFDMRLQMILTQFPQLEDIHPFYADLINVLYDRDHYKMALGHVNVINKVIQNTSKEFLKLLKYGESAYRPLFVCLHVARCSCASFFPVCLPSLLVSAPVRLLTSAYSVLSSSLFLPRTRMPMSTRMSSTPFSLILFGFMYSMSSSSAYSNTLLAYSSLSSLPLRYAPASTSHFSLSLISSPSFRITYKGVNFL